MATFEDLSSALRLVELGSSFRLAEAVSATASNAQELEQVWVEWAGAKEASKQKKAAQKHGKLTNGGGDVDRPDGARMGEPARVTWWRLHDPAQLAGVLGESNTGRTSRTGGGPKSTSTMPAAAGTADFETDVLRRAMEAAEAKKKRAAQAEAGVGTAK